ncbi:MAG: DUF4062 domain-containing protein [bacterium]|nr:DUF4062 domain-containing protein [bacterium]
MDVLRVFAASPGDVAEERKRLKEVIDELNHSIAEDKGLMLKYVGWETDTWPDFGKDPQDVINKEIDLYDIFIGIMWKRFGTPTKRAKSGTEEEFDQAYKLWSEYGAPRIMLYFNKTPFFPSSVDDMEQMTKVLNFKKEASSKGGFFWEYTGPDEFEKSVRQHLTKVILKWIDNQKPVSHPQIVRLPLTFFRALVKDLDEYIALFEQLQRDYSRELNGEQLEFAVDFSEIHNYMYPYSDQSPRSSLNQYIFNSIKDPLTLMPGAVGELLTDLERALPSPEVLKRHPMVIYKNVATFINNFQGAINNEEKIIELYSQAEAQLKGAWGELFGAVMKDDRHTALYQVKSLIDRQKLSPIMGIHEINDFPSDVRERIQRVKSQLHLVRPERDRNNQVDTIDFGVTWLLNSQEHDGNKRYLSIYTQSQRLIHACTSSHQLRWKDDYLVRGAQYFKFRTKLQEEFPSTKQRKNFAATWSGKCRQLQKEIPDLFELEKKQSKLKKPSLAMLDLYRQFDEDCRKRLEFSGESSNSEKPDIREKATELYRLMKTEGQFMGKTGDAFNVLKKYLEDLQRQFMLFAPEKVHGKDSKTFMENLAKWTDSVSFEESKK